jgi:membrane protein implicated in regulation of membrane protease activity
VTLVHWHEDADAAASDAYGAMMGSIGLVAFAAVIWLASAALPWWLVLLVAAVGWLAVSVAAFWVDDRARRRGARERRREKGVGRRT